MRPHRRVLFFVGPDPDARDCYGYCGTPPWPPTVPSSPDQGPAPSPAPASSPLPACPPISLPPAPSPSAHRGRRNQGGGMNGYGPPPPLGGGDDHRWHYVRYALIAAGVIAFVSLILLGVSVAVRRRQVRRRRQAALLAPAAPPPPGAGGAGGDGWNDDLEGGGGGGGGGVVHHVWYIRTVGLDEAAINSIAATRYRAGAGLLGAADCSVCLGEFQDGELVRLLPKCAHAFHVPCIDTWLRAHVNCPLCRSDVIDPAVTAATGDGGGVGGEVSSDPPADLDANDNVEAEQPAAASDAIPDHEQEDRDIGHQEEQEASPAVVEDQQERSSSPDPPPPPPPQQQQQQFCSLPRNVRRAASMDPATVSTAADVAARERLPEAAAPEEEQIGGRRKRSCAKASGSGGHRSNLSIDRQASVGIPRSFFSRHSRARSSVLPLSYPS